ncbi:MAG: S41 family peptidase [Flavobacteriales bacterium]|nr:S41 family peptidase [Flavobacteriales bacterium]
MKGFKIVILFFLATITGIATNAQTDNLGESLQKIHRLFSILDNNYVDNYNAKKATEDAIRAILKELDPHSNYLTADELKSSNENLKGSFEGVGITYNNDDDTLLVLSTVENGPADKAGICPGDRIIFVGDSLIAGINISGERLSSLLRGKKGSEVVLKIVREDYADTLIFKVKRDKVPVESVTSYYMINSDIAYIKVIRFGAQTADDLKSAIKKLKKQGMQHLVLDLRGNPGGYLHIAVEMLDEFIDKNELILYTEGKESKRKDYFSKSGGLFEDGRLAVLIDENSASASEIISGAVQDLDRGIVIGRRSFGKGLVQNTYSFADGSAARITTARYYTPSGRCIQRPYSQGKEKYYEELKKRFDNGELTSLENIQLPDSLKFLTKSRRVVYGGGGIMPDIFVPIDTLASDSLVKILNQKNLLYRFSVKYADKNRKELSKKYPSFDSFKIHFKTQPEQLDQFKKFCEDKGFPIQWDEISTPVIRYTEHMIKANIARVLWNTTEFTHISNEIDPVIQTAVQALENNKLAEMVQAK